MNIKTLFVLALCILVAFTACKDKKSETKEESASEVVAEARYQCPMNCEDGKTYDHAGTCPVCKMELTLVNKDNAKMTCSMDKDGKCSNANCEMHAEKMECTMDKDGKCSNANCKKHAEKLVD